MELVSRSCNRDFTSASSYGLGWYEYAIATQWYQFHTTDAWWFSLIITSAQKNLKCVDEQCPTFPMAKPKCLTTDFTNLNGIYKSHQTNVWWWWSDEPWRCWAGLHWWVDKYFVFKMFTYWLFPGASFTKPPFKLRACTSILVQRWGKCCFWAWITNHQSGTKPNLVAKILATNFGNFWA